MNLRRFLPVLIAVLAAILFVAGSLLTGAAAQAGSTKKIVAADCNVGGCRCMLTSLTVDDVAILTGERPPPGAEGMTLVMAFGEMLWVSEPRDQVHRRFGGTGSCPLELFPGATTAVQPRDGVWEFATDPVDMSRCPLAAQFGVDPPAKHRVTIRWGGRFDPNRYMPLETHFIHWTRMDERNWRGTIGSHNAPITTTMRAQLVDSQTIRGWGDIETSSLPREKTGCIALQSSYTARWVGGGP